MDHVLLTTERLTKCYTSTSGSRDKPVVNQIELEVKAGEFLAVMGSSGSGKSTLLYLLSGLEMPSEGWVGYGNFRFSKRSEKELAIFRRDNIGFVFQSFNLVPYLSLLENVVVPGWLRKTDRKSVRRDAERLLREVGIDHLKDRLPAQVSGGEQQRCAIARALINRPRIIFADEPTGNLNSATSQQVLDLLTHFHRGGQTIVMVTHDLKSASRADKVLFIQDGAILDVLDFRTRREHMTPDDKEAMVIEWLAEKSW